MNDIYSKAVMSVIAVALSVIAWNQIFPQSVISPASAEWDARDTNYIQSALYNISDAIKSIRACND